ncbi:hypothetical protein NGRA_1104 [Nosema granulosis]|uniref:Uncharacterized protein n=1 Tax=Nosema granulosis TaxID=83296 RepID=A0A9P6H2C6_9MICR|nr:hypothetical protein NGRA_1104 [Nosema granulosis]
MFIFIIFHWLILSKKKKHNAKDLGTLKNNNVSLIYDSPPPNKEEILFILPEEISPDVTHQKKRKGTVLISPSKKPISDSVKDKSSSRLSQKKSSDKIENSTESSSEIDSSSLEDNSNGKSFAKSERKSTSDPNKSK